MIKVMGRYRCYLPEEIDNAETEEEARHLLTEYRLAYRGQGWSLWLEEENDARTE